MFHPVHNEGVGVFAVFGFILVILTDVIIRALGGAALLEPGSWWLMLGCGVAAFYCAALNIFFALWEKYRDRTELPEPIHHSFMGMPFWAWSLFYLAFGYFRVTSPE